MAKQITTTGSDFPGDSSTSASDEADGLLISAEGKGLDLTDHFLIAMPSMLDPIFGGTVVYICEHNARGAMGMVINKPTDMTVAGLFDRIDLKLENIPNSHPMGKYPVMFGGPVQDDRGFVLHAPSGKFSSTLKVTEDIAFTTSRDILEALAAGDAPERLMVSIGYSGWGAGQLEQEILANGWLTVAADKHILFDLPMEQRFVAAMGLLGIDPMMLASVAGHA
ncbi:MAG: YqgE/AlgH family protein [Pseudomonadota bacterium]